MQADPAAPAPRPAITNEEWALAPKLSLKEAARLSGMSTDGVRKTWIEVRDGFVLQEQFDEWFATKLKKSALPKPIAEGEWVAGLKLNKDGSVKQTRANAMLVMLNDPEWMDLNGKPIIQKDLFTHCIRLSRPVPGTVVVSGFPRQIEEHDLNLAVCWLQRSRYGIDLADIEVSRAMSMVSDRNSNNPVLQYFESCWDTFSHSEQTDELDTWLVEYFNAVDTPYVRKVARYWALSAVARVVYPGCQADHVLVLEGDQGIGKSTACQILACNDEWYLGEIRDMGNKETPMQMSGKFIVEFSELGAMRRSDNEKTKEFLTARRDKIIKKYSNLETTFLRTCVFAATVNPKTASGGYLTDPTGNRRFWPVRCGITAKGIDTQTLRLSHRYIWGAAYSTLMGWKECSDTACRGGVISDRCSEHRWWPTREEQDKLFTPEQSKRVGDDIWCSPVVSALDKATTRGAKLSTLEIFAQALEIEPGDLSPADQNRMLGLLMRVADEHRVPVKGTNQAEQRWTLKPALFNKSNEDPPVPEKK